MGSESGDRHRHTFFSVVAALGSVAGASVITISWHICVYTSKNAVQWIFILHIREIKDGDDPTGCTNDHFLTPEGNLSLVLRLMWKPAHSPPGTVKHQAENPSFGRIQIKGGTTFIRCSYLCQG
jgi:hypothetical protein